MVEPELNLPPIPERAAASSLELIETARDSTFRQLLDSTPDAILVVDLGGSIVFANQQSETIFGYTAEQLIGQPIESLMPERMRDTHRGHRATYAQAPVRRPMGIDMTLIGTRADGSEFPAEVSLSPVEIDGVSLVCAAVRDVSRLQSARDAMVRAHYNAQIAQLGRHLIGTRDLMEIADVLPKITADALGADAAVLFVLSADRQEIQCRGAHGIADALLPRLRFSAAPDTEPGYVLAADDVVIVEDFATETRYALGSGTAAMGHRSGIGIAIGALDGPIGVLLARFHESRKFSEDDKNFMRSCANIVGAAVTTTRAEERLRHSQQLEAVGQLTGGIAHDFNNLLTVILGNLQMIEADVADDDAVSKSVEAALRAAGSAADLTRKLLTFSRRQALRPRPFDVNERVGAMLEMIRRTLGERITILAHPDPGTPLVLADPNQFETALLNLVVNARDAMPKGGRLTIETGTRLLDRVYAEPIGDLQADRYVMIAVSDNGTGMSEDTLRRCFEPYFTTKERGKGSGLGLSMVHGFAKQSRGHVSIYSEFGHGTTVRLFLPIADRPETVPAPTTDVAASGHETILMVEDNEEVRVVGARFLAALGYQVLQAVDGEQALDLLARHPQIRLLFADIMLPGRYTGKELAEEARRRRPDLSLLFTSGYASGAIEDVDQLPARLLDKPYRRETLAAAVRAALDRAPR